MGKWWETGDEARSRATRECAELGSPARARVLEERAPVTRREPAPHRLSTPTTSPLRATATRRPPDRHGWARGLVRRRARRDKSPDDDRHRIARLVAPNVLSFTHWDRLLDDELYASSTRLDWRTILKRTFGIDLRLAQDVVHAEKERDEEARLVVELDLCGGACDVRGRADQAARRPDVPVLRGAACPPPPS